MLTNSIKLRNDDVISDVTANSFRMASSVFGTCEYYNLISLQRLINEYYKIQKARMYRMSRAKQ